MIDWEDILVGWNRNKTPKFKTVRAMLKYLYKETKSGNRMADTLGVAYGTVYTKMDELGVKRSGEKGGKNNTYSVFLHRIRQIPPEELVDMTAYEIAAVIKIKNKKGVHSLLKRYHIPYKLHPKFQHTQKLKSIPPEKLLSMPCLEIIRKTGASTSSIGRLRAQYKQQSKQPLRYSDSYIKIVAQTEELLVV